MHQNIIGGRLEILVDERAGFCRGVKRVISMAEQILDEKGEVVSLGEIIHNHEESERLEKLGMKVIDDEKFDFSEKFRGKALLVRAHGTPADTFIKAEKHGLNLINGTCPVVTRSQKLAGEYHEKGYQVVIVGKAHHPEVIGIQGYCNNEGVVVYHHEDLNLIDYQRKTFVLAQTTIPQELFDEFIEIINSRIEDVEVKNTICKFVLGRDKQLKEFVEKCDVVVMVGGRHSSNTRWLFDVCLENNPQSHWIETKEEIKREWFNGAKYIGVTGSASTPQWLLEEVKEHIQADR